MFFLTYLKKQGSGNIEKLKGTEIILYVKVPGQSPALPAKVWLCVSALQELPLKQEGCLYEI